MTAAAVLDMAQPQARRCAIWVDTATLKAAQELADFAGLDVDSFIEFVVQELHDHETERARSVHGPRTPDARPSSR
jgi:hypothetical protein